MDGLIRLALVTIPEREINVMISRDSLSCAAIRNFGRWDSARRHKGSNVTPGQCRQARDRLYWSQEDLAKAVGVSAETVATFEAGELVEPNDCQSAIREVLESVGIGFPFTIEEGKPTPADVIYSPREMGETN